MAATSRLELQLEGAGYPYLLSHGGLVGLGSELRARFPEADSCAVVADRRVQEFHGANLEEELRSISWRVSVLSFEPGEQSKRLEVLASLHDGLSAAGVDRRTPLITFGGGVASDLGGFAAATWLRGIRWVAVPTTLLAQVDAALGGKTGINHASGKNRVGAFWQPSLVYASLETLRTLPDRQLRSGLAEVVKSALVGDRELFELLAREPVAVLRRDEAVLSEAILRAARVKARIVEQDEREGGVRRKLNLGHTVGHILEFQSLEGDPLLHGEAVALGTVAACDLAVRRGTMRSEQATRVRRVLDGLGLPTDVGARLAGLGPRVAALLAADKKREQKDIAFQLPNGIGSVADAWLPLGELSRWLEGFNGGLR